MDVDDGCDRCGACEGVLCLHRAWTVRGALRAGVACSVSERDAHARGCQPGVRSGLGGGGGCPPAVRTDRCRPVPVPVPASSPAGMRIACGSGAAAVRRRRCATAESSARPVLNRRGALAGCRCRPSSRLGGGALRAAERTAGVGWARSERPWDPQIGRAPAAAPHELCREGGGVSQCVQHGSARWGEMRRRWAVDAPGVCAAMASNDESQRGARKCREMRSAMLRASGARVRIAEYGARVGCV